MGLITEILGVTRTDEDGAPVEDIQIDGGGGANVTARHVAPPGDDSPPLAGDKAFVVEGPQTGSEVAVGYLDGTAKHAAPGEKRIYARDSGGKVVAHVWLKGNGDVVIESLEGGVVVNVGHDGIVRMGSDSASAGVARLGDKVQVTIPASTFLVAAQAGVMNPSPVVVDGEITEASSVVMAD